MEMTSRIRHRLRYLHLIRLLQFYRVIGVHPTVVGMWIKMSSELGYCLGSNRVYFLLEGIMDILNGKIKPIYLKLLAAAVGSAMVSSIFSMVDAMMVGR